MLTPEDHARIEAAVAEAESGTTGDILVVLAGEVSTYREVPLMWAAALCLVGPPLVMTLGRPILDALTGGGWTAAEASGIEPELSSAITAYAVLQVLIFALVAFLDSLPPVRRALTPRFLKRHRVKRAAFHHFAAAHSHAQDSETGVLIFVALVDRQVQVLADKAIHEKAGDEVWGAVARAVQEGMKTPDPTGGILRAIQICGEALKRHFPTDQPRKKPDRPMDI